MPNWTSNRIYAEGSPEQVNEFLATIKGENGVIDFNSVIPMPALLKHTSSGHKTINGKTLTSWYVIDPTLELSKRSLDENEREFTPCEAAQLAAIGYTNWYEWSCDNWNTKWNACRAEIEDEGSIKYGYVTITFDTAWDAPQPVLQKLPEMFPRLSITCEWRHEDESAYPHRLQFDAKNSAGAA